MSTSNSGWKFRSLLMDATLLGFNFLGLLFLILQPSREALLNMTHLSLAALGSCAAGAALAFIISKTGGRTLGDLVFSPPEKNAVVRSWYQTFWGWELLVTFFAALYTGLLVTEFSLIELFSEAGFQGAVRIFRSLSHPNFEVLPQGVLAIITTIFMAFTATVFAIPIAFFLAFLGAKNIMGKKASHFAIYMSLRTFLNVARSIEPLIWAIIFSVWVGIGPFAGMLALMLHSVASLTKQYSEIIESVSDGPIEGVLSTGASPFQVIWYGIVPQIVLPYVSFTIYRWDINVRMATVIGLVGGGGIGTMLIQYQGQAQWEEVGCLIILIAAVVWFLDTASAYIREAIK